MGWGPYADPAVLHGTLICRHTSDTRETYTILNLKAFRVTLLLA